jgi:hypothetical protein
MTEPGMYMSYAPGMDDDQQESHPEVEREERRLARLRLVTVPPQDAWEDDDEPDPQAAA